MGSLWATRWRSRSKVRAVAQWRSSRTRTTGAGWARAVRKRPTASNIGYRSVSGSDTSGGGSPGTARSGRGRGGPDRRPGRPGRRAGPRGKGGGRCGRWPRRRVGRDGQVLIAVAHEDVWHRRRSWSGPPPGRGGSCRTPVRRRSGRGPVPSWSSGGEPRPGGPARRPGPRTAARRRPHRPEAGREPATGAGGPATWSERAAPPSRRTRG